MARFFFFLLPVLSLLLCPRELVFEREKKKTLQHRGGSLWSRACCRKKLWIYSVYHRCRRSGTPASSTVSTASWLTAEDIKIDAKLNLVPTTTEQHLPDGVSRFPPVRLLDVLQRSLPPPLNLSFHSECSRSSKDPNDNTYSLHLLHNLYFVFRHPAPALSVFFNC